jgi:hypothetical protein
MGHEHNIALANSVEGGEEVLVTEVEHLDAKLRMGERDYVSKVEGDDEE